MSLGIAALLGALALAAASAANAGEPAVRITYLFDNTAARAVVRPAWGFACLVEAHGRTVLFDTGADAKGLAANMKALGVDASRIEAVVISHFHGDHTRGIAALDAAKKIRAFTPRSFDAFPDVAAAFDGAGVVRTPVLAPRTIADGFLVSRPMPMEAPPGVKAWEQALVVDTPRGAVVLVGCSHPGIVAMVEDIKTTVRRPIIMVLGGFHLLQKTPAEVADAVAGLKALGVRRAGPTHCTGEGAIELFRQAFGDNFIRGGVGAVVEIAAD